MHASCSCLGICFQKGHDIVCLFVNDTADSKTIKILSENGVKMIANRCAGFDRVDTKANPVDGISRGRLEGDWKLVPIHFPQALRAALVAYLEEPMPL